MMFPLLPKHSHPFKCLVSWRLQEASLSMMRPCRRQSGYISYIQYIYIYRFDAQHRLSTSLTCIFLRVTLIDIVGMTLKE